MEQISRVALPSLPSESMDLPAFAAACGGLDFPWSLLGGFFWFVFLFPEPELFADFQLNLLG
jgi:hypothetical protein